MLPQQEIPEQTFKEPEQTLENPKPQDTQKENSQTTSTLKKTPLAYEEKIVLNSKNHDKTETTKEGKTRIGIIYAFAGFLVVIIILLALRKL